MDLIGLDSSIVVQRLVFMGAKSLGKWNIGRQPLESAVVSHPCITPIGSSVCDSLFKLIATLLVLKCLATLTSHSFPVAFSPKTSLSGGPVNPAEFQPHVVKAIDFVTSVDRRFPSLYTRLELGGSWEEVLNHPAGKLF